MKLMMLFLTRKEKNKMNKWEYARFRFIRWLNVKIAKTQLGEFPPKWIRIIHWSLFPLRWVYANQSQIRYSFERDTYTIDGIEIHFDFICELPYLAKNEIPVIFVEDRFGGITIRKFKGEK